MTLQRVKKLLAAVLIGSMLSTLTVSAGNIQDAAKMQAADDDRGAADIQMESGRSEKEDYSAEGQEGEENLPVMPEPDAKEKEDDSKDRDNVLDGKDEEKSQENVQDKTSEAAGEASGETGADGESEDETAADEAEAAEDDSMENGQPDERTQSLIDEYKVWLRQMRAQSVGSYSSELAKFPASYQNYLKQLHAKHPNWIFVAVNQNLDWNDIVAAESVSGSSKGTNRSLLPKTSDDLLLSKADTDYNVSKGAYVPKDGTTWVSASRPAVAYYADPRNFLTDNYIYMFEALNYDSNYHRAEGVRNVLSGTDLYGDKKITYMQTNGKKATLNMTYEQAIFAAGAKNKVSPLFLAAKIRQETGAKLSNGSISGDFSKTYRGYYNYYNIGAYSTTSGSAIANGLLFAQGGTGKSKTYKRPWTSPVLAIDGGAEYIAKSYISRGQNTVYFQRFNTVSAPYYQHQYMQNLTAAASEAKTTYNSYSKMGIVNDTFVFYIPVYKNMPSQSSKVTIKKSVKTGKTTSSVTMRSGPSAGSSAVVTVPKGKAVTISGAEYTGMDVSVVNQEKDPYWFKAAYGSKTGYISGRYIAMDADSTIKEGGTKQLSVTNTGGKETVYYETSNPAVAVVNSAGKVTGVKEGACDIYAVTSSGKQMDAIGISVKGKEKSSGLAQPKLVSASNSKSGVLIKWKKVANAKGYYIYRKKEGGKFKKIKQVKSGKTVKYTDKTMSSGKKYVYTVKAYNGGKTSSYDKKGITIRRLSNPSMVSASGTKKGIKVKWKKVRSAVTYDVYRKTKGGKYKKIATVKSSKLTYTDKTAKKGKTYYYTARACSGIYKGDYTKTGVRGKRK